MGSSITTSVQEFVARQPRYTPARLFLRWLIRTLGFALVRVEASGLENVPARGPTILMINHISYIDPVLCAGLITNRFVISMSKAENMRNLFVRLIIGSWGVFPVRRGEVDRTALLNSIELLRSGQLLLIAPEGTRHPEGLAPAKDGLAYIATRADAVIVPVAIGGAVDWLSRLKQGRPGYARVAFGRPFRFHTQGGGRIPRTTLSEMMQEAMHQLALTIPDEYAHLRGFYSDLSQATTQHLHFVDPTAEPAAPEVALSAD